LIEGQEIRGACSPDSFPSNPEMTRKVLDTFFADEEDTEAIGTALLICSYCQARDECLDTYMSERFGVFGGKTASERQAIRKIVRHK